MGRPLVGMGWGASCRSGCVGGGDGDGDAAVHLRKARGGPVVEAAEGDDAFVVRLVAVVEDEIVAGSVVAEVADVGDGTVRGTLETQGGGEGAGLLDPAVVAHLDGLGQLGQQVTSRRSVLDGGG